MSAALRRQGLAFSVAALLLTAASLLLPTPDPRLELLALAALIVVLGVPHGALDPIFAAAKYRLRDPGRWAVFALAYLAVAALVVAIWRISPTLFLAAFLVMSAVHFSGDPTDGTPWPTRLLYGGAIIVLPALLHGADVARLFAALVPADAAAGLAAVLHRIGWPWLIALLAAASFRAVKEPVSAVELVSVTILATLMPPLPAFAVFFCGMHSARHILRTAQFAPGRRLFATAIIPMLGVVALAAAGWWWLDGATLDGKIIQLVFVGLAALTVPHMALVERVRLAGWGPVSADGSDRSSVPRSGLRRP